MKITNPIIILFYTIILFGTISSCNVEHNHDDGRGHEGHGHGSAAHDDHEDGPPKLTTTQIQTIGLTFGDFSKIKINDYVKATGMLGLPSNAYSSVNARSNGFIKGSKKYVEGSYVKKGIVIASLENPDFIHHQQKYLEVEAQLTYLLQERNRQQALVDASAGIVKNLEKLNADIKTNQATLKGLEKQLNYLGIKASELTPDNIVDRIAIIAPMAGYITSINLHNGMYVTPQQELMEIVSEKHLHLELDVFEKDIAAVKEGQKISYVIPALGNTIYDGEVHVIGKEFNTNNKTVRIHGHLEGTKPRFIKDLFIEAKIWLNDQLVQALPEKAIIKDGAFSYIFITDKNQKTDTLEFEAIKVIPGLTDKGFTSIKLIDKIPDGKQIVTKGAYYVYAQSMAGELEHNH